MADTFGPITIPLGGPVEGEATTDPALSYLLAFLKAFLVDDHNATAAWSVIGVAAGLLPVAHTDVGDPEELPFSSSFLPALYAYRDSGTTEQLADSYRVESTHVKLVWIFPLGNPQQQRPRTPFVNGLVKAIDAALNRGRTPGWVVDGDPDVVAEENGSFLGTYMQYWQIWLRSWKLRKVNERGADGTLKAVYQGLEMVLDLSENLQQDPTREPIYSPLDPATGAILSLEDGATGNPTDQGYAGQPPPPPWTAQQAQDLAADPDSFDE